MLDPKQKYLQIALNNTLYEAQNIISQLPLDKRIIIEAGTPLIKAYGVAGIRKIRFWWEQRIFGASMIEKPETSQMGFIPPWINSIVQSIEKKKMEEQRSNRKKEGIFTPYIVADLKCMDRGGREVQIAKEGGASAAVALGYAPIETLDAFIEDCEKLGLDSMIDMMNVEYPLNILRKLKQVPHVVILHRGVDEEHFNKEKEIPYHEVQRIKGGFDILIAIAGGDTIQEIQRAIFNDADIAVVWKSFYNSTIDTAKLAEQFLKEIR